MAIKLTTSAEDFDTATEDAKVMLGKLQSNILKPDGRNFARHIFLRFTAAPDLVKKWIGDHVTPLITTAASQFNNDPAVDAGLAAGFFLSATGYEKLGFSTRGFASDSFRAGMKNKDDSLFDRLLGAENKDPDPQSWEPWSRGEIDALVNLADDDLATVEAAAQQLTASAGGTVLVLSVQEGNVLRRTRPDNPKKEEGFAVEHFGYRDGISQPIFTKAELKDERGQHWDPAARLDLVLVDDPLTDDSQAFGSYLVYRKLAQDLRLFDQRVEALSASLDIDPNLAGAYAVGRFKDGTPIVRSAVPTGNDGNDFDFRNQDPDGARCPMHAHIRKANPRGTTPLTTLAGEKRRRIARRGIPYGPPIGSHVADFPDSDSNPDLPRGLLFLCFQANIEEQFEFIMRTWIDNENFPRSIVPFLKDTGDDPLIGQDSDEAQRWPHKWGDADEGTKAHNFESAVDLRGGEYFFAPSIPFLKSL